MNNVGRVPEGFHEILLPGGFFESFGSIYGSLEDGVRVLGLFIEQKHINPMGVCHGAVIASLADMQALGAQEAAGIMDRFTPTISMTVDFIAPAKIGNWVEMRIELLRTTRTLLFSRALITADKTLVARSSAIFKIGTSTQPSRSDRPALFQ